MTQTFSLKIAPDTLAADAAQLAVSVEQLSAIQIMVRAVIVRPSQLHLHYQITLPSKHLAKQLHWPKWQQQQVTFTDYLWQQTCLECFIAKPTTFMNQDQIKNQAKYIEINASPNGQYAIYSFDSYRNPASSPPAPLLQPYKDEYAQISWSANSKLSEPTFSDNSDKYSYQRRFSFDLAQLEPDLTAKTDDTETQHHIGLIHPCVILTFGKVNLYFAPSHAAPPDFHQQQYWTAFHS